MKHLEVFENFEQNQNYLIEKFNFSDIYRAIEFVKSSCDVFTELDHHPDYFCLNGKTVEIRLTTHSQGGVSQKDSEVVDKMKGLIKDCCKPFNPHLFG